MHFNRIACRLAISALMLLVCGLPTSASGDDLSRPGDIATMTVATTKTAAIANVQSVIRPSKSARIAAGVSGRIESVDVRVGEYVKTGEVLARIDPRGFELNVKQAESELAARKASVDELQATEKLLTVQQKVHEIEVQIRKKEFARFQLAFQKGAVSKAEFERAQNELANAELKLAAHKQNVSLQKSQLKSAETTMRVAEAVLAKARLDLSGTVLKAPFSGIVSQVNVDKGNFVRTGDDLCRVDDTSSFHLIVPLPLKQVLAVTGNKASAKYTVRLNRNRDVTIAARFLRVAPTVDPATRTVGVHLSMPPPKSAVVFPGELVSVAIQIDKPGLPKRDVICIPVTAVFPDARGRKLVWLVDRKTGKVRAQEVEVQRFDAVQFSVTRGLTPGDVIVSEGAVFLKDGAVVPQRAQGKASRTDD